MEKEYDLCELGSSYDINPMIASVLVSQIQLRRVMALIGSAATLRCREAVSYLWVKCTTSAECRTYSNSRAHGIERVMVWSHN